MIFIEGGGTDMAGFEKLLVVRGLRLLRLARVLRMVGRFKAGSSKPAMGGADENTWEFAYRMLGRVDRYDGCSLAVSIIFYQGNPKPLKRQVHRKKTGFYPKTRVFEFPNFPLVHFPIKSCLWCSKINNVVISMLPVVLCRAGLETLLGNCSYISQMHDLQLSFENAPTNNVNFCIPGTYTTTWIVYLQINISRWASDPFSHEFCPCKPSVGLKAYYGSLRARPQKPIIFLRVPTG